MFDIWRQNVLRNHEIVRANGGPGLVIVVSGSELDRHYWQQHFAATERDVFRADGSAILVSISEPTRKGNFLGTLRAWEQAQAVLQQQDAALPPVSLMSMVFGQGKRLSPFTQCLGNRKAALPTPLKGRASGEYLRTADLSNLYANSWTQHLAATGFRGLLVKWGDEAVIPGVEWRVVPNQAVDGFRFVWRTRPTPELAREKDWVVIDDRGYMACQYARQSLDSLESRIGADGHAGLAVGVNLGSLAISYDILELALEIFRDDLDHPTRWVDWDPYVWMALFTRSEAEWQAESEQEERLGRQGIRQLIERYPDFYAKIVRLREAARARLGRDLAIVAQDFGLPLWADWGLHTALRAGLCDVVQDSARGALLRDLYALPHERDDRGNIIRDASWPSTADIRDSVIVDTSVTDPGSIVHGGVLIGGRFGRVEMPQGGAALFSAAERLAFTGPNAIAIRAVAPEIRLGEGGRQATLFLDDGGEQLVTAESVIDYDGANYGQPILSNALSFAEAARRMSQVDGVQLERRWLDEWQKLPDEWRTRSL